MELIKVAVDAMGGDNAPDAIVMGCVEALELHKNVFIYIVGIPDEIERVLSGVETDRSRIEIVPASEVIETTEHPVAAIRKKTDSSIVVGMGLVRDGKADGFVSAGCSGAILVGGQLLVGRIRGIERAPFAPILPTKKGFFILLDAGANVDSRATWLVQWAKMGSVYMKSIMGIENPRVAIVNNGAEDEKGNALVKETIPLLKECEDLNFVGSIEARDIPDGFADVVICDAFVGNVILKLYEGLSSTLVSLIKKGMMSTLRSKIGAALALPALKKTLKAFDTTDLGGAPMLGLNGLVVKTHGNAKSTEIKNAITQCIAFTENKINDKIREYVLDSSNE